MHCCTVPVVNVLRVGAGVGKPPLTPGAAVGLLPAVQSSVLYEVMLVLERLLAPVAGVGPVVWKERDTLGNPSAGCWLIQLSIKYFRVLTTVHL